MWFPMMITSISARFCISVCWAPHPYCLQISSLPRKAVFQVIPQHLRQVSAGAGLRPREADPPSAPCAALTAVLGAEHPCPPGRASVSCNQAYMHLKHKGTWPLNPDPCTLTEVKHKTIPLLPSRTHFLQQNHSR